MTKLLIKFHDDWADEMDVEGFFITTQEDWDEKVQTLIEKFPYGLTYVLGTNEDIEYESPTHILKCYKTVIITDELAQQLENLFPGKSGYGFPGPVCYLSTYIEELEEEENEE